MADYLGLLGDPRQMGILGMAGGLLQAGGPSRTPTSFGQAFGQGLMGGSNAAYQASQANNREQLTQAQLDEMKRKQSQSSQTQGFMEQYAATLPPEQRAAFMVSPETFIKGQFGPKAAVPQFAPSNLGKLISERNALPADSPLRSEYDKAIKNLSESQERSPSFQFFPTANGIAVGDRRAGTVTPPAAGSPPMLAPGFDPNLQRTLAAAKAGGKEAGEAQAQAEIDLPRVIDNANNSLSLIDQMVGPRLPDGGRGKPHPGFGSAVGLRIPGATKIPGTDAANFQAMLDQVKGGAFLEAFNSLKGGGQITEVEGKKATDAITRMSNAQSEREFILAARDYQGIIEKGVQRAKIRAGQSPERRSEPRPSSNRVVVDF